jgi:hypothetical protein
MLLSFRAGAVEIASRSNTAVYQEQPNVAVHDNTQKRSTRIRTRTVRTVRRQTHGTSLVGPAS